MLGKLTLSEAFPTKCYMQANNLSPEICNHMIPVTSVEVQCPVYEDKHTM